MRRVLVRAVSGNYERAARAQGKPRPRTGAVSFVQRFDSALRLNVHFHFLWLDGAYAWQPGGPIEWCEHEAVTDADVATTVKRARTRVLRCLRRLGKWPDEQDVGGEVDLASGDEAEQLLLELDSAAVQGRTALGERAGDRDLHAGRGSRAESFVKAPLCADIDGFSLHAAVVVPAHDRDRLEKLCRYAARPAIAESRLSLLPDGRVAYELKRRWKNGTTHVVMEPQVLLERLCALVPRPRKHLVTYHGVLAPAAGLRSRVVPAPPPEQDGVGEGDADCRHAQREVIEADEVNAQDGIEEHAPPPSRRRIVPHAPKKQRRALGRRRYPWAELLKRVFSIDALLCHRCGGRRTLLAAIHDPASIAKVLGVLGLAAELPELAPARGPPDLATGEWFGA